MIRCIGATANVRADIRMPGKVTIPFFYSVLNLCIRNAGMRPEAEKETEKKPFYRKSSCFAVAIDDFHLPLLSIDHETKVDWLSCVQNEGSHRDA